MSQAQLCSTASPSVSLHSGRPATTSLEVAKFFGKQHNNVIRSVREIADNTPKEFTALNFELSEYADETGRTLPMFILHRDGFMLLVMGYTGKKAMQIKIAYIQAFNAMEAQLAGNALPHPAFILTPSTIETRKPLEKLVKVWAQQSGVAHAQLWTQVNAHFNINGITELPVEWVPDAIAWVQERIDAIPKALPESRPMLPAFSDSTPSLDRALKDTQKALDAFSGLQNWIHISVRTELRTDTSFSMESAIRRQLDTAWYAVGLVQSSLLTAKALRDMALAKR